MELVRVSELAPRNFSDSRRALGFVLMEPESMNNREWMDGVLSQGRLSVRAEREFVDLAFATRRMRDLSGSWVGMTDDGTRCNRPRRRLSGQNGNWRIKRPSRRSEPLRTL